MIAFTYIISGVLLAVSGHLFAAELLTAAQQTLAWTVIFFFASAAASSAYLTVSETFPLEIRALAIAIFYAVGTGIGGMIGPWLFGVLIDTGSRMSVFGGYLLGAGLMVVAGVVAAFFAVPAERKPLEDGGASAGVRRLIRTAASDSLLPSRAVAGRDRSVRDHLGIDAAVGVAIGVHQRPGIARSRMPGVGIDLGRGAAHDPLDDLQPRRRADRDFRPEQIELMPGRPALDVDIAAEAQRMHRRAGGVLQRLRPMPD